MNIKLRALCAAFLACAVALPAQAVTSLDLGKYSIKLTSSLTVDEASGITFNPVRQSLLVIGDEARAGEYALDGSPFPNRTNVLGVSSFNDPEGLTYIGNGQYVIVEERFMRMWLLTESFEQQANGELLSLGQKTSGKSYSLSPFNVGNIGLEGIAYDPLSGDYFGVKQEGPQAVYQIDVDMQDPAGGSHIELFDPAKLGLITLSDIAVLTTVPSYATSDFASNLLILSATSEKLLEVNRQGDILSSFDLSNILGPTGRRIQTIEGITLGDDGDIYLAAEQGGEFGGSALIVLEREPFAVAVPEPATWAMMIGGFGLVGISLRRDRRARSTVSFS